MYLARLIKPLNVSVTRIAHGIPLVALEYRRVTLAFPCKAGEKCNLKGSLYARKLKQRKTDEEINQSSRIGYSFRPGSIFEGGQGTCGTEELVSVFRSMRVQ